MRDIVTDGDMEQIMYILEKRHTIDKSTFQWYIVLSQKLGLVVNMFMLSA